MVYLNGGGFPKILEFRDPDAKTKYVSEIVGQIFEKDIRARCKIKNRVVFEKVMTYLVNNFGSRINLQSLEYFYIQVAMTIADAKTEEREYRALSAARDHYPRYLFTLDTLLQKRDGVKHVNLIDFISAGKDLASDD